MPPRSMAAWKTRILAQNPPVGGTPASEIMNAVIATARMGARRASPAKSVIRSVGSRRLTAIVTENAPIFMIA